MTDNMTPEVVDNAKVTTILTALVALTAGPREAYGVLITALYRLNFEVCDETVSMDQLCTEVAISLRSITQAKPQ